MISPQHAAAVVPCLNEARSIAGVVEQVKLFLPLVIVVDDGSTDATARAAQAAGARVLRHERNLGKGAALNTGLDYLRARGFRAAMLLDGDGQHDASCIPTFLNRANVTGAGLVVGNRMGEAESMSWVRRWVNRLMSAEISRLAGMPLPDTQCGFRLLDLQAWRSIVMETRRFEVESEMILGFARAGFRIEFVSVSPRPAQRESHICPVRDTLRWFRWLRHVQTETLPARNAPFAGQFSASC